MRVAVAGLWHLGCVTAACLAQAGHDVAAFDPDPLVVAGLEAGHAPLFEPGLDELLAEAVRQGRLEFTAVARRALTGAEILWVTFDTPVDDHDNADVAFVRGHLEAISGDIPPATLVLTSSQVPVGFTRALERDWAGKGLTFAYSPENLRLGRAIQAFREPARVVAGVRAAEAKRKITELLSPLGVRIEWMSVESAEMTKHALNAFLATSVAFINEVARLCEAVGADAKEVERGLKSEPRIGPGSYVSPGGAFAGGTLARDVRFLESFGRDHHLSTPLLSGAITSNDLHKRWLFDTVARAVRGRSTPVAAVLGLTYKPGTNTLRRSSAVELCTWLHGRGIKVQAHDPAVSTLPAELETMIDLRDTPAGALDGADVAIVSTEWPVFRSVTADDVAAAMRHPVVIDQNRFLAATVGADRRVRYVSVGATSAATMEPS